MPFTTSACPLQGLTDDPLKDLIQLLVTETRHHDAVAFIEVSSISSDHYLIQHLLAHLVQHLARLYLWLRKVVEAHHLLSWLMTPPLKVVLVVGEGLHLSGHSLIDEVLWWNLLLYNCWRIKDQDRVLKLTLYGHLLSWDRDLSLCHLLW